VSGTGQGPQGPGFGEHDAETMRDVLASIRELVSAEATARMGGTGTDEVLMLTPDMRIDPDSARAILSEGLEGGRPSYGRAQPAPILDEEALRGVINTIVREELQGELGERIARNLRKLVRRELGQVLEEERRAALAAPESGGEGAGEGPGEVPGEGAEPEPPRG
jgi:hypothetical protein